MAGCKESNKSDQAVLGDCLIKFIRYKAHRERLFSLSQIKTIGLDGASPSGKAPAFDAGIRRFDPCRPSHFGLDHFYCKI
jgi:hypothetical protein